MLAARRSSPSASSSRARTTRYCAIVSAVPPDFDVTTNSAAPQVEPVEQRGDVGRIDVVEHVQPRLAAARRRRRAGSTAAARSAVRSAIGPSAEPPMPSTTTSVERARARLHAPQKSSVCWCSARSSGRSRKPSVAARVLVRDAARARPRSATRASRQSAAEIPPSTAAPSCSCSRGGSSCVRP